MKDDRCEEMHLLIQADVDGELAPAEAARVGAHVARCTACAETQERLIALSGRLREEMPRHPASEALRTSIQAQIAALAAKGGDADLARVRKPWRLRLPGLSLRNGASFGAGFALAACLALAVALPSGGDLSDAVIGGHIRALQPGHLMDVASTDQHTVKPWFDGRLDFVPPVKDLMAEGFPLAGGRLDYLAGRPVAALVYRRRQHVIDLFAWPDGSRRGRGPAQGSHNGYNFLGWRQDGMDFWAVSDLNAQELADFVRLWQAS